MFRAHILFWQEHPALLWGLSYLVGVGAALFGLPVWFSGLWLLYVVLCKQWASIGLWILSFSSSWFLYGNTPEFDEPIVCRARFSITNIQAHQSPFYRDLLYRGTLFLEGHSFPCAMSVKKDRPSASCDYWVEGTLQQRGLFDYTFKPKTWTPVPGSWSMAEFRYQTKQRLHQFLEKQLHRPRTASFLYSLVSGDVEDRQLRYEFGRLGLQHILAISGFHFGLLMASFSAGLGLFLSRQWKWGLMLVCATGYFVFVGSSPAVQRAWIGACLFLLSKLLGRPASAINLLGGALLIELMIDPLVAVNLGFQLSFGSCFGILLLHRWVAEQLERWFPKRPIAISSLLPSSSKVMYLISSGLRKALSLTFAVNGAILPMLLYHFGKFPWLSLLYNLFYPLCVGFAMLGLVVACIGFFLFGPLSKPVFSVLDWWTAQLLDLVSYPPLVLDKYLYVQELRAEIVLLYLFGLLMAGIWIHQRNNEYETGIV